MAKPSVSPNVHQAFYVHGDITPQVPFHFMIFLDDATDSGHFFFGQVFHSDLFSNLGFLQDVPRNGGTHSVYVGQGNSRLLIFGNIYTRYSRHCFSFRKLTLPLLMLGVLTNNPHDSTTADHLAFTTNWFDR
jgi:hypothetical protein